MRRNILVTSATGSQARGLIRSFLSSSSNSHAQESSARSPEPEANSSQNASLVEEQHEHHIYALTRRAASTSPKELGVSDSEKLRLHLVQGDLNDRNSIERIFTDVGKTDGGLWGVFAVLPFPGLGVDASGEERMGKMLADLSVKHGVRSFVYSSAMRLGEKYETEQYLKYSARAKIQIENYVQSLSEKGLPWSILQPGFFMENFEGFKGALAVAILKKGLKSDTTISFVAAEDVGKVAAEILRNPAPHKETSYLVVSEFVTLPQIEVAHLNATKRPLPSAPKAVGWGLNKGSSKTRELMVNGLKLNHKCRTEGDYKDLDLEMTKTKEVCQLQSYAVWKAVHN